jgi:hypothetical protein
MGMAANGERRWQARPVTAAAVRIAVFVTPIAVSMAYVYVASHVVSKPAERPLFLAWWIGLSATATVVVIGIDKITRRLLPLAALFKLSLVFPDRAPSRFGTAMRTGTVETLEERLAAAREGHPAETPAEAAERLLLLVAALDRHDRITRGHSERVRAYTRMIGEELHLSEHDLDLLNWAALLHDVGKLSIPYEILNKPGKPTREEWDILRMHPVYGAEYVAPLREWLGEWACAVTQHHERWDGKGYPAGLQGEQISYAGRIVAVADVFDVITSARSYKEAFGPASGRAEIADCAGTQFDPRVVRALLNVSLGRLRFAMGPLSWLANAPILGRLPLTPAVSTIASSAAAVAAVATAGLAAAGHHHQQEAAAATPPAVRPPVHVAKPPAAGHVQPRPKLHHVTTRAVSAPASPPNLERDRASTPEDTPVNVPVLANDSDPNGLPLRLVGAYGATSGSVEVGMSTVTFSPLHNYSGRAAFAYVVSDGQYVRRMTALVDVVPVDDAPQAVPDTASTTQNQAIVIAAAANDTDPENDPLHVSAVNDPSHGTAAVVDGEVRFEPPHDFTGSSTITYTVGDGHGGSADGTIAVTVGAINTAPSFTAGPDLTVREDAGPQSNMWASHISPGPGADNDQVVTFTARTDNASLFTPGGAPHVAADGTLSYTAADDANGSATVTVQARDDGGHASGGDDTGPTRSFTITVTPVNDPPRFTPGAAQSADEDSGAHTVAWASAVSPGPDDEAAQHVHFEVSTTNGGLFSAAPAIAPNGALTFTGAADANGAATVTVRAADDGGTADGGVDTGPPVTFTITLGQTGDPPVANDDTATMLENGTGVDFDVLANDTDADGATLAVTSYDASTLDGTLIPLGGGRFTYVPSGAFSGQETFTYTVGDGAGGTSSAHVTITVVSEPDAPIAADDAYVAQLNTPLGIAAPTGLLANDSDDDGDSLTVQSTTVSGPAHGVVVVAIDGSFGYVPNGGFVGTDSFDYKVVDSTGRSDIGTVTITVVAGATSALVLYLEGGGPSVNVWSMSTPAPPAATPVPDYDGDGKPGLFIQHGNGEANDANPSHWQEWVYAPPAAVTLNGPVKLDLWAGVQNFQAGRDVEPRAYLYDCAAGGVSCTLIASGTVYIHDWQGGVTTWTHHDVPVGSAAHTIAAGRELRVRLLVKRHDLYVAFTAAFPTALTVTTG